MTPGVTKPDWDTPADGDFVAYIERLQAKTQGATAPLPASAQAPLVSAANPAGAPKVPRAPAEVPVAALLPAAVQTVVRRVRWLLVAVAALDSLALAVWGTGSLPLLFMVAALWWALGRLAASGRLSLPVPDPLREGVDALQERLRQLAADRSKKVTK